MLLFDARKKVMEIALKVRKEKLVPLTFGNFSLRDKETGYICITPSGMDYEVLKPEDILVVDEDRNIIDGKRKPSIETPLHCCIYKNRKDVYGIVHVHSTFASSWACSNMEIPPILAEGACLLGGPVKCAPYRLVGGEDLGQAVVETLASDSAVLMGNHGMIAVGLDIDTAFSNAIIVEECAKIALYSKLIGNSVPLGQDECDKLRQFTIEKYGQE